MATDNVPESLKALWRAADEAFLTDVNYSIAMAEASSVARVNQQKRDVVPRRPVGV